MEIHKIGVATKPQALKGQFRVKPSILNLNKLKKIKSVVIDNCDYIVESINIRDSFFILKLKGVDSCEHAETFRNKEIFASIDIEVSHGEDLQGYEVYIQDSLLGTIVDVNNYGSKDVISISGDLSVMMPNVDGLIESIDSSNKRIQINKGIFETVAVYED